MKNFTILLFTINLTFSQITQQKTQSTYFGGNSHRIAFVNLSPSFIDNEGNIIVISYVDVNEDFNYYSQFTTPGAFQTIPSGDSHCFLSKFTPSGELIWSTYFGGEGDDGPRAIAVDANNNIYMAGIAVSFTNIGTSGAFIESVTSVLSSETGFLAKFSSNGQRLWSTYIMGDIKKIIVDDQNNVLVAGDTPFTSNVSTPGSYKDITEFYSDGINTNHYGFFMKFNAAGQRLYGTYLERGSIYDFEHDELGNFYFVGRTSTIQSATLVNSSNSQQQFYGGGLSDGFILKMNPSVTNKIWSTFYGGFEFDFFQSISIHNNNLYLTGSTKSISGIATIGSFQPEIANTNTDFFIAKFDLNGQRVWGTYYGGFGIESLSGLTIYNDKLYLTGQTTSSNLGTPYSYQPNFEQLTFNETNLRSSFFSEFTLNGERNWCSYYNGVSINSILFSNFDGFYITGSTASRTGVSLPGAIQPTLNEGTNVSLGTPYNLFLSKFEFMPYLSATSFEENSFSIVPNPSIGKFIIKNETNINSYQLTIYDALGRIIKSEEVTNLLQQEKQFDYSNLLSKGIYVLEIISKESNNKQSLKLIVD